MKYQHNGKYKTQREVPKHNVKYKTQLEVQTQREVQTFDYDSKELIDLTNYVTCGDFITTLQYEL